MPQAGNDNLSFIYDRDYPLEVVLKMTPEAGDFDRIVRVLKHECGGRVTGHSDGLGDREKKLTFEEGMLIVRFDEMLGNSLIAKIPERVALAEKIALDLERYLLAS